MRIPTFMLAGLLGAGLLVSAGMATAQALPRISEFYFAADGNTAKPVVVIRETGEPAMQKLLGIIERNPRAHAEAAQLAHLAFGAGRPEVGRTLYERALRGLSETNALWRSVVWNQAWDLYRAGDSEAALASWARLVDSRTTATWMPHTLALALWSVDRKDEAVKWYAAAVRSEPDQWRTTARYEELLPDWSESERATLAEVQAAWAEDPPSWP